MTVIRKLIAAAGLWLMAGIAAALPRDVVVDPLTGFAMDGFDPVAYFADGGPREGRGGIETNWRGVAWRFANAGNLAAFEAHPEVYAPAFGGHCPVAMARGYVAEGAPDFWTIHDGRLLLFHDAISRRVFEMAPAQFIADAEAAWPGLFPW